MVSAATPVSLASTRAAVAVGATANTGRPAAARASTAGRRAVVLPVPAGPTTTTSGALPATAWAAACWARSNPPGSRAADRPGCDQRLAAHSGEV